MRVLVSSISMLPKSHRGLQSSQIRTLFSGETSSLSNRYFRINWQTENVDQSQFVVIISKKTEKTAVKRNLMKRRVYQSLQEFFSDWTVAARVAILVKSPATQASSFQCHQALQNLFRETGLLT